MPPLKSDPAGRQTIEYRSRPTRRDRVNGERFYIDVARQKMKADRHEALTLISHWRESGKPSQPHESAWLNVPLGQETCQDELFEPSRFR